MAAEIYKEVQVRLPEEVTARMEGITKLCCGAVTVDQVFQVIVVLDLIAKGWCHSLPYAEIPTESANENLDDCGDDCADSPATASDEESGL